MPTYEYACNNCKGEFEIFQKITDDPLKSCPECEGELRRKISAGGGLLFKGSGFYATDYKKGRPAVPRCGSGSPCCGSESVCGESSCH